MNSPRYAPAGLMVEYRYSRVTIDGGSGAAPKGSVKAWLVTDERGELIREIRKLAARMGVEPTTGNIGRPTIRSLEAGRHAAFGEFGREGTLYVITKRAISKRKARRSSTKNSESDAMMSSPFT